MLLTKPLVTPHLQFRSGNEPTKQKVMEYWRNKVFKSLCVRLRAHQGLSGSRREARLQSQALRFLPQVIKAE